MRCGDPCEDAENALTVTSKAPCKYVIYIDLDRV